MNDLPLRCYYAALAMQSLLATAGWPEKPEDQEQLAKRSFSIADAMLKEGRKDSSK